MRMAMRLEESAEVFGAMPESAGSAMDCVQFPATLPTVDKLTG